MSTPQATKTIILGYWQSWQDKDWTALRNSLGDTFDMGGNAMPADAFVEFCRKGNPWKDVTLIDSMFTAEGGALIYEGTNTADGSRVRVAEIVRVQDGKVHSANACFGSGVPPQ